MADMPDGDRRQCAEFFQMMENYPHLRPYASLRPAEEGPPPTRETDHFWRRTAIAAGPDIPGDAVCSAYEVIGVAENATYRAEMNFGLVLFRNTRAVRDLAKRVVNLTSITWDHR